MTTIKKAIAIALAIGAQRKLEREAEQKKHKAEQKTSQERNREYYLKNQEHIRERRRERYLKEDKEKIRVKNKEHVNELIKADRQRHPQRWKVRRLVARAIKRGKLKRAEKCSSCGVKCKTEAHHHNGYSDDRSLDVIWLCHACHCFCHRLTTAKNS